MNVKGVLMDYTLRQVVKQKVVLDDTGTNNHIKVTASPTTFFTNNSPAKTAAMQLTINHGSILPAYDQSDVEARYILATEKNYASISATDPGWKPMTTNATGTAAATTSITSAGLADGEYYLHWYVVSGTIMAHSEDAVTPLKTHGAFGPYIVDTAGLTATIEANNNPAATQEITDFSALPVKIIFNKPIDPASFTNADFTLVPAGLGSFGTVNAVPGSDNKEFTAIFTPSNSMYNGQEVQIKLTAGSINDLAGNANAVSNTVTLKLKIDSDIPTVSFGNVAEYDTLTPSFTISLDPGDTSINGNTSLYLDALATTTVANGADLSNVFKVRRASDGVTVPSSGYTVIYSASTKQALVTFTAAAGLANSTEYKISIAQDGLYNKLCNGNVFTSSNFKIAVPEVTGISADKTVVDHGGETVAITVTGVYLDKDFAFTIYLSVDGKAYDDELSIELAGTMRVHTEEVDRSTIDIDLSNNVVAAAADSVSGICAYLGAGVHVYTNMHEGQRYCGQAKILDKVDAYLADRDLAKLAFAGSDVDLPELYSDIVMIYKLQSVGLRRPSSKVKLDRDQRYYADRTYYVYDENLRYVGVAEDSLPYSSFYFVADKRLPQFDALPINQ